MAIEQYFEETMTQTDSFGEDNKWKSVSDTIPDSENNASSGFDCSICLELVQDPVVTLCGHLYCWPCIYKWLHSQNASTENEEQQQQCPVCKAEISQSSLVPLYGKGQTTKLSKTKAPHLGVVIPRRPLGPACWVGNGTPRSTSPTRSPHQTEQLYHGNYSYQSQPYQPNSGIYTTSSMTNPGGTVTNLLDPMTGVFGEMVYARVFGNTMTNLYTYPNSYNLAGSNSPRFRRHVMQADRSLNRICFFLFCCSILCLLLF